MTRAAISSKRKVPPSAAPQLAPDTQTAAAQLASASHTPVRPKLTAADLERLAKASSEFTECSLFKPLKGDSKTCDFLRTIDSLKFEAKYNPMLLASGMLTEEGHNLKTDKTFKKKNSIPIDSMNVVSGKTEPGTLPTLWVQTEHRDAAEATEEFYLTEHRQLREWLDWKGANTVTGTAKNKKCRRPELQMRIEGLTFAQIGEAVGRSKQSVFSTYQILLARCKADHAAGKLSDQRRHTTIRRQIVDYPPIVGRELHKAKLFRYRLHEDELKAFAYMDLANEVSNPNFNVTTGNGCSEEQNRQIVKLYAEALRRIAFNPGDRPSDGTNKDRIIGQICNAMCLSKKQVTSTLDTLTDRMWKPYLTAWDVKSSYRGKKIQ
jgi:hypothetical protein